MNDNHKFFIPAGLRPLRIPRLEQEAAPALPTCPVVPHDLGNKERRPKFLNASRDYYLSVARKLGQSRPLRFPLPSRRLCCCFCAPKVKQERSDSALELSMLLQPRSETWES